MADYSDPAAPTYHPPHHPQRFYNQQQQQQHHSSSAVPTTSNERHNAGGEPSNSAGSLQRNDSPYMSVYTDDGGNGTTALDSTSRAQSTSGARYFQVQPSSSSQDSNSNASPNGPVGSAPASTSSYDAATATPTQQYAQPQQAYDSQGYTHHHQSSNQQQLAEVEVGSSFQQHQQSQQHQASFSAQPTTSSALAPLHQQQRQQNPQFLLPPPPSYRQPTLSRLPAHPDDTIPHYTFGASPLNASDHAAPKVGQTRCYWTLLSAKLTFVFLDPVLQLHMGPQGPGMATRCILDFIHPDEVENARKDLRQVLERKTGTGSITRVRFLRLSAIRLALGANREDLALWKDQERIAFDSDYLAADLVINWVADGLLLCFIHAIVDLSKQDNDETSKTPWTNWCGAALMDDRHSAGLARALESQYLMNPPQSTFTNGSSKYANPPPVSPATTAATSASSSPHNEDVSHPESYDRPYSSSLERNGVPDRIFQILRNDDSRELMVSYPKGGYDPKHLSSLANGVSMVPYGTPGNEDYAKTNCTRRLECTRAIPDPRTGNPKKVGTLYIPHGQVIFACHRVQEDEPEQNQHYHPYPSPNYDGYQAGPGGYSRNQDDVPPTPSSHGSQEQSLHGYNSSYPPNSYGRANTQYSGSWPPSHENRPDWGDSYGGSGTSYSGYGAGQSHSTTIHSRTQQTQSLRSTQSSQNLHAPSSNSSAGLTSPDSRNPVPYSRTNSGFGAQGSYTGYGHSYSGNGQSWNSANGGWEEQQTSTPLPHREIQQPSSSRYHDPYSYQQQITPDTPVSANPAQQHFQDNVSTALRPVRIGQTPSRHSPPGLKRSADDMLYSGGSASGSGDERSTSPPQGNMYPYTGNGTGYNDGSPPGSYPRPLIPAHREPGGSRSNGNPPPGIIKCVSCGIDNSPEWRKGENGVKNLCNACGLRYARSKQKREGIIPQRRKKKDKGPNAKGKKVVKGKRQGSNSASPPPPMMTTPPEEKAQPMDLVDAHEHVYRDPSPGYRDPAPNQYPYYGSSSILPDPRRHY